MTGSIQQSGPRFQWMFRRRSGRIPAASLSRFPHPPRGSLLKEEEGTLVWLEEGADGERLVAKLYRRRGVWNQVRGRLTTYRTERELQRLRYLEGKGVACTPALGWDAGWCREHGQFQLLVMEEVPEVVSLAEFVRERGETADLAALFRLVRKMHEAGFCCQTLYASNVLVARHRAPAPEFVIADVPRSWIFPRSIVGTALARLDLLDLLASLGELGWASATIAVDAYGPVPRGRASKPFVGASQMGTRGDPRGKRLRLARDLAARVRWAAAWTLAWISRLPIGGVPGA
jgi:hypothetical protein